MVSYLNHMSPQAFTNFIKRMIPRETAYGFVNIDENIVGFLLLMHRSESIAQLRFFYLDPPYRGIGLGKKLMTLYMEFLTQCGYTSSYLWTTHEQTAAASLYQQYGFTLMEEKNSSAFGKPLREQRYEFTVPIDEVDSW